MKTIEGLTEEQQMVNFETMRHIEKVRNYLNKIVRNLLDRGEKHDQSKLCSPEVEAMVIHTEKLPDTSFNSPEYKENLENGLKKALDHHYANNSHHPQHYKNGVDDMDLVDLIEMFCDWKASAERQHDGNIRKSIENNGERFGMSPQLIRIFENTVGALS